MQNRKNRSASATSARHDGARAFNLIESVVVLAVIFVLAFILVPVFRFYILGEQETRAAHEDVPTSDEFGSGLPKPAAEPPAATEPPQ